MDNSESCGKAPEENGKSSEKPKKEKSPYALPSDAQLLAYWHYRNRAKPAADPWKISHTLREGAATGEKRWDKQASLIEDLRGKGTHGSFSKTRYAHDIRLLSKWRLIAGQKRDGCIQLDQQLDIEQKKYLQIRREYKQCLDALEQFLKQDHDRSMRALFESEAEMNRTNELSAKRDQLSRIYGQARLDVYRWEESWRTVKACHRFLHKLSPYEGGEGGVSAGASRSGLSSAGTSSVDDDSSDDARDVDDRGSAATTGGGKKITSVSLDLSLDNLIGAFERESIALIKSPAKSPSDLGLLEASDLIRLFRDIEQQNLNALIHLESLTGPMSDMITRIEDAEMRVKTEIDDVIEGIRQLETSIEREESRARRLERQSGRLIQRSFRALVCSEQALRTRVLVEDAYEACVAKNEAGLDALAMARGLEHAYEALSSQLDRLPRQLVAACEKEGFRQEMRENREAEDAARKFELMHRLLSALRRILEPSEPKRRVLMKRSTPVFLKSKRKAKKQVTMVDAKSVTARQALYQDFFGENCKLKNDEDESDADD